MKKYLIALGLVCSSFGLVMAQAVIKFSKETHDFGEVKEGDLATYEFEFTNTGNQPLIVSNVQPSCGCTSPFWTKEPVMPGKKGSIKATYSSQGRPGVFNKSLTVVSNASNATGTIYIKGMVKKKEAAVTYTEEQLKKSPKIVIEKNALNLGKMEINQKVTAKFQVKNTGASNLEILDAQSTCHCTTWQLSVPSIPPGGTGTLNITYDPRSKGKQNESVYITSNDLNNSSIKVTFDAEVLETLGSNQMMKENKSFVPFK